MRLYRPQIKKERAKWFWFGLLGGLLVIFSLGGIKLFSLYGWGAGHVNPNITSRLVWWEAALGMIRAYPWLGVGIGNFPSAYLAFIAAEGQHTLFAHNYFLGLIAETGALGAVGILVLALAIGRHCQTHWAILQKRRSYLAGVLAVLLYSTINIGLEYLVNLMTLFIMLGVFLAPTISLEWKPKRSMIIIFGTMLMAAVPFLVSPFLASQHVVSGEDYYQQGNWSKARTSFSIAKEINPASWRAYQGEAKTFFSEYEEKGDKLALRHAITGQKRAIFYNKLNALLHWEMGQYLSEGGEFAPALSYYQNAFTFHKTNQRYRLSLENAKRQ